MAVHADVGAPRRQVPDDAPGTWPEVLEGVLRVDAALDGMPLQSSPKKYQASAWHVSTLADEDTGAHKALLRSVQERL